METVSANQAGQPPVMYELSGGDLTAVSGGNILKRLAGALFKAGAWVGRKWHDHACPGC